MTWLWLKAVRAVLVYKSFNFGLMFPSFCPHQPHLISFKGAGWLLRPHHEFLTASAAKNGVPKGQETTGAGAEWRTWMRAGAAAWSWTMRRSGEEDRNETRARADSCSGSKRGMNPASLLWPGLWHSKPAGSLAPDHAWLETLLGGLGENVIVTSWEGGGRWRELIRLLPQFNHLEETIQINSRLFITSSGLG